MTAEDWRQIAKANPSYPKRTPREAILRMRKRLSVDSMRREGFGLWDVVSKSTSVVTAEAWARLEAVDPPATGATPTALGLDRWYDGTTSIAGAWRTGEVTHVELVAVDVEPNATSVVDWVVARAGRKIPVFVASDSPAVALVPDLVDRKVKVEVVRSGMEYGKACGGFVDDVEDLHLTHADQQQLNDALRDAVKLPIGKAGLWGWDRRRPDLDISSLVAATMARHGAINQRQRSGEAVFR